MATSDSEHVTLVAATVSQVQLTGTFDFIEVQSDGGAEMSYVISPDDPTNPTNLGDGTFVLVAAASSRTHNLRDIFGAPLTDPYVEAISAGTPKVNVMAWGS